MIIYNRYRGTGISLGKLNPQFQTLHDVPLYLPVKWQWSPTFLWVLSFANFFMNIFLQMQHSDASWCNFSLFFVKGNIFFLCKTNDFICVLS